MSSMGIYSLFHYVSNKADRNWRQIQYHRGIIRYVYWLEKVNRLYRCIYCCASGPCFTNGFSIAIQIRWKFRFTLISILIQWSLQNVVHGTTVVLSWHVQNFVAIWWPTTELQQGEVSFEFELREKKSLVKRAPERHITWTTHHLSDTEVSIIIIWILRMHPQYSRKILLYMNNHTITHFVYILWFTRDTKLNTYHTLIYRRAPLSNNTNV